MSPLVLSTRALKVVNKGIDLFHHHGFHLVGVDRIVKESEITKMTFYHYFQSKARFIEICLLVQKERLQDKVVAMVEYDHNTSVTDKLNKLYNLHIDLEGPYYLLFKAIFETKNTYSNAYQMAIKYRTWLTNEIYSQLRIVNTDASFYDAKLFLYMIEGAIIQLLSSDNSDVREGRIERVLIHFSQT
ncbi:TPA: helix-turn-helix transcriptional regulator [Acinetobacter nosocomialis]|uniref:TetR/AcrR family transcriptional regulator n=1 Tax=Acinetobacter nosocomialis TaxID=106654 RepID=UPI0018FF1898|nr:helix-turn-helix domain-containing protein [Acinetobacter nosocomialis]MBJ8462151.1 helix-turn-helix transcriptional regulator [Acinetobacter nosocomialis]HEM7380083.1 helix-turn-helix transcriptional regulator [Acinetobacter nosocomialis]HEM8429124.1 helix-turn-helix transcriptional regulator [Acinetobacter nosocomialis]